MKTHEETREQTNRTLHPHLGEQDPHTEAQQHLKLTGVGFCA